MLFMSVPSIREADCKKLPGDHSYSDENEHAALMPILDVQTRWFSHSPDVSYKEANALIYTSHLSRPPGLASTNSFYTPQ